MEPAAQAPPPPAPRSGPTGTDTAAGRRRARHRPQCPPAAQPARRRQRAGPCPAPLRARADTDGPLARPRHGHQRGSHRPHAAPLTVLPLRVDRPAPGAPHRSADDGSHAHAAAHHTGTWPTRSAPATPWTPSPARRPTPGTRRTRQARGARGTRTPRPWSASTPVCARRQSRSRPRPAPPRRCAWRRHAAVALAAACTRPHAPGVVGAPSRRIEHAAGPSRVGHVTRRCRHRAR